METAFHSTHPAQPPDDPARSLDNHLQNYYRANDKDKSRLEATILQASLPRIRNWLRAENLQQADLEDRISDTSLRLLAALRRSCQPGEPTIREFWALARTATNHSLIDASRRNDLRHALRLRLRYLTRHNRYAQTFARWNVEGEFLIGLTTQRGEPARPTPAYRAFCADDTAFVHQALQGRDPATPAVKLPELLEALLGWIGTPLEEKLLITHLATLTGLQTPQTDLIEDLALGHHRVAEDLWPTVAGPEPSSSGLDWEVCWQHVLRLPLNSRRALLLSWDRSLLQVVTGQTDPSRRGSPDSESSEAKDLIPDFR